MKYTDSREKQKLADIEERHFCSTTRNPTLFGYVPLIRPKVVGELLKCNGAGSVPAIWVAMDG